MVFVSAQGSPPATSCQVCSSHRGRQALGRAMHLWRCAAAGARGRLRPHCPPHARRSRSPDPPAGQSSGKQRRASGAAPLQPQRRTMGCWSCARECFQPPGTLLPQKHAWCMSKIACEPTEQGTPPPWAPGHQVSRLFSFRAPAPCEASFCPSSSFVSPLTCTPPWGLIPLDCTTVGLSVAFPEYS